MIAPTSFFADYGCHVRILEEIRILQKLGHQVTLVTYYNGNSVDGIDIRRTLPIPWRRDYEVGSSRHKLGFDVLLGFRTIQLLLTQKFDLIHGHLHEGALIGLVLGRIFGKPVVFDFQGSLTEEMIDHGFLRRESHIFGILRRLERWIDRSAAAILPSSNHAEKLLIDEFGCAPDKIRVLPDCVNTDEWKPKSAYDPAELDDLREHLGIPKDAKVIVYLGLLTEYQGISHLLEAVRRILMQHKNVYLLLMGFPSSVYQLKAQAMGISDNVILTGKMPYFQAPKFLALGDVAAAPKLSQTEGSGKLLNYMATALPTVAFDTPVAREYMGHNGIYAESGSIESLAENLERCLYPSAEELAAKPLPTEARGTNLRQRAKQRFDWLMAGLQIEEVYTQITNNHKLRGQTTKRATGKTGDQSNVSKTRLNA